MCDKLGNSVAQALPTAHALTGCDITSSLYKIGTRTAYSKLVHYAEDLPSLCTIRMTSELLPQMPVNKLWLCMETKKTLMVTYVQR